MSHSLREFPNATWPNPADTPYTGAEWFLFFSAMCAPCKHRLHKLCTGKPVLHAHATSSHCSSSHWGVAFLDNCSTLNAIHSAEKTNRRAIVPLNWSGKQTQRSSFYHFWDGMRTKLFESRLQCLTLILTFSFPANQTKLLESPDLLVLVKANKAIQFVEVNEVTQSKLQEKHVCFSFNTSENWVYKYDQYFQRENWWNRMQSAVFNKQSKWWTRQVCKY